MSRQSIIEILGSLRINDGRRTISLDDKVCTIIADKIIAVIERPPTELRVEAPIPSSAPDTGLSETNKHLQEEVTRLATLLSEATRTKSSGAVFGAIAEESNRQFASQRPQVHRDDHGNFVVTKEMLQELDRVHNPKRRTR